MNTEELKSCFKDHKATLIVDTEKCQVLEWKNKNGSSDHCVIYTIHEYMRRSKLTICGDLGSAVLDLTWFPRFENEKWIYDYPYFFGKLDTTSEYDSQFNIIKGIEDIRNSHLYQEISESQQEELEECFDCNRSGYAGMLEIYDNISNAQINDEYECILEDFDLYFKVVPVRHQLWLLGLQMASAQLRGENDE